MSYDIINFLCNHSTNPRSCYLLGAESGDGSGDEGILHLLRIMKDGFNLHKLVFDDLSDCDGHVTFPGMQQTTCWNHPSEDDYMEIKKRPSLIFESSDEIKQCLSEMANCTMWIPFEC